MGLKAIAKKVVGPEKLTKLKGIIMHRFCSTMLFISHKKKMAINTQYLVLNKVYFEKDYHVFRGYYDIDYFNYDFTKILCHRLPLNNKYAICEVGYYDRNTGEYDIIGQTKAWCWQQGSRLRWHPLNKEYILYNDIDNNEYCTRVVDINTKRIVDTIGMPLYDINRSYTVGISINFERLQRLRPGYGYSVFGDMTLDSKAPEDDGIFCVDLRTKECRLLFSLKELAEKVDNTLKYIHYVNHISFSPDGNRFLFFHIYTDGSVYEWNTVLYVADVRNGFLIDLEHDDRVSHYCWIDDNRIMVTCHKKDGNEYYCNYNIETGTKEILSIEGLETDGHPCCLMAEDEFLTDTYPLEYSKQKLLAFSKCSERTEEIASFYHDYRLRGEYRCDLHPSVSHTEKYISVDSTYKGRRRSVVVLEQYENI